jgi:hypothetical protein
MIPVKLESRIKLANAEPRGNVPAISQSAQPISKPTIRKYLQDPGGPTPAKQFAGQLIQADDHSPATYQRMPPPE